MFRIGQEIIRFEPLAAEVVDPTASSGSARPAKGYIGRIALVIGREVTGNAFPIPETGVHLGRERGDILFPEDGYVSGLHCRLSWDGQRLFLTDLGSSNGTFVRVKRDRCAVGRRAAHGPAAVPRRDLMAPDQDRPRRGRRPREGRAVPHHPAPRDGRTAAHVGVPRRPRRRGARPTRPRSSARCVTASAPRSTSASSSRS